MFSSRENYNFEGVRDDKDPEIDKPYDLCEESSFNGIKGSYQNASDQSNPFESGAAVMELKKYATVTTLQTLRSDHIGEISNFPLEHCLRILPHDQNSGAFFIAVLRKLSPLQVAPKNPVDSYPKEILSSQKSSDRSAENIFETSSIRDDAEENSDMGSARDVSEKLVSAGLASVADLPGEGTSIMPIEVEANGETSEKHKLEASSCENGDSGVERKKVDERRLQMQGKWRGVDPIVFFQDRTWS